MNNNELFLTNDTLENSFEGFYEFSVDLTLDNVAPELLIATYTGAYVA